MNARYVVTGGIHRDFSFQAVDGAPENYGPFSTYADAFECWKSKVWLNVDNALHRLFIREEAAAPARKQN